MATSMDQVALQVVRLNALILQQNSTNEVPHNRIRLGEQTIASHEDELFRASRRGGGRVDDEDGRHHQLADRKFCTPPVLTSKRIFREWARSWSRLDVTSARP